MRARYRSPEWRANVARGLRRRYEVLRRAARITPSDLVALARVGSPVRAELRPLVDAAASELEELVAALGGQDHVSPQRLLLAQDVVRLGLLVRALMQRFAQSGDADLASRLGTLLSTRRAGIVALGLERHAREVSLKDYVAQRERETRDGAGGANGSVTEAEVVSPAAAMPGEGEEVPDA